MYQRLITLAVVTFVLSGSTAFAQCGCNSPPVYTSVAPSYATSFAPAAADYGPAPYVSNYAPPVAPVSYVSYYSPPVAPVSTVSYYAPPAAPVSYVSYYAPAAPAPYVSYYAPATSYVTYAPVVAPYRTYYGVPGVSIYGTPQVYVPGEPVRNALRAITP